MTQTQLFKIASQMRKHNRLFNPIPASRTTKRPLGNWANNSYLFEKEFQKREAWDPDCNMGLLVSEGYAVIDVDDKPPAVLGSKKVYSENKGTNDFDTLVEENEPIPFTLSATTPSGGRHYYFALTGRKEEEMLKNWTSCMSIDGKHIAVDIRKKGGYVMCPPSTKGANKYTWDTREDFRVPMAPLPNWILKNIVETMKKNPKHFERQEFSSDPSANSDIENPDIQLFVNSPFWQDCFVLDPQPDRNNFIRITATQPYYCDICQRQHVNNTNHPFLVRNHGKLRFVCRPGPGFNVVLEPDYDKLWEEFDPLVKAFVEKGDVSDQAISNMIFEYLDGGVLGTGKTHVWRVFDRDVGLWRKENRDVIMRPFVEHFTAKFDELEFICRKLGTTGIWADRQSTCFKASHSMKMTSTKGAQLSALYEIIRDNRHDEKFDSKLNLLHCTNKVIDLDTEEVRDARPDDYLTKSTRLEYVPYEEHTAEKRALVEKFLDDITLGDKEMKKYLLKILTSSLHGRIKFQFFFMFLGRGANGKSLLIKLMKRIFCDYHAPIPSSQVTKPGVNAQSSTPALMTLKGARGAFVTELQEPTLYTEFVKMLAGGDSHSGREHHGNQEEIPTTARLFIALNDLPIVLDKTPGFWRKIVILPFEAQFKANPDPNDPKQKLLDVEMETKLMACADTFLALLVQVHFNEYKKEGIYEKVQPAKVKEAVKKYQYSQNLPLQFYDLTCVRDATGIAETRVVKEAFDEFCKAKAVARTQKLVEELEKFMDEKHPPSNPTRQVRNKITAGRNKRGWTGVRVVENKWSIMDDVDDEGSNFKKARVEF